MSRGNQDEIGALDNHMLHILHVAEALPGCAAPVRWCELPLHGSVKAII